MKQLKTLFLGALLAFSGTTMASGHQHHKGNMDTADGYEHKCDKAKSGGHKHHKGDMAKSGGHKHQKGGKGMKHANPMPNLMKVVKHHGDELGLSEEQSNTLAKWRAENHSTVHTLGKQVKAKEKAIREASLNGKGKAELLTMLEESFELRLKIAAIKTECRDNMQGILSPMQYQKVIEIYRRDYP